MAKKEARRAARQAAGRKSREKGKPTWYRAFGMALLLSGVYFVLMEFVVRSEGRTWLNNLVWSGIFFAVYVVFIYYWETFLYRRRRRKQDRER